MRFPIAAEPGPASPGLNGSPGSAADGANAPGIASAGWRQDDYAWTHSAAVEGLFIVLTVVIVPVAILRGRGVCAPVVATAAPARRNSTREESSMMRPLRLVPDNTHIPFMRGRLAGPIVSAVLSIASMVLFFWPGVNYGVDFRGGVVVELRTAAGRRSRRAAQRIRGVADSARSNFRGLARPAMCASPSTSAPQAKRQRPSAI